MRTIKELERLCEDGAMTKEAASRIVNAVIENLKSTKDMVESIQQSEGMDKQANLAAAAGAKASGLGSQLLTGLLSSVGLTLGGLGVNYIADEMKKSKEHSLHQRSFQEMYRIRPGIQEIEPQKVQEFFSIFSEVSPELAKNPFLAANFVERQANAHGGVGFEEVGQLARTNEALKAGKGAGVMSQIGDGLTQQGIQSLGTNVGYMTRVKLDEKMKDPALQGRQAAMMEAAKELQHQEMGSGMSIAEQVQARLEEAKRKKALDLQYAPDMERVKADAKIIAQARGGQSYPQQSIQRQVQGIPPGWKTP